MFNTQSVNLGETRFNRTTQSQFPCKRSYFEESSRFGHSKGFRHTRYSTQNLKIKTGKRKKNVSTRWNYDRTTNNFYKTSVELPSFRPNFTGLKQFPHVKKYSHYKDGSQTQYKFNKIRQSRKHRRSLAQLRMRKEKLIWEK